MGTDQGIEQDYREMMQDEGTPRLVLVNLFEAVNQTPEIKQVLDRILQKNQPLTIVLEGSATPDNIDIVHNLISSRDNPNDKIVLFDINSQATDEHEQYIKETYPEKDYRVAQGNMMSLGLSSDCADLVINDCAINYCESDQENRKTLEEIGRVLKDTDSVCLFSVGVDRQYDDQKFGEDQELVGREARNVPGTFLILPEKGSPTRKCWLVPYYEDLFGQTGFSFRKFDVERGKNNRMFRVSYRRYLLQKNNE
ncbi:methyltransferase domain-containing protein [Patescibacteria group bacterium]|nr:methyltransferase domain-containing protein [Patescibacteria group bacterium]